MPPSDNKTCPPGELFRPGSIHGHQGEDEYSCQHGQAPEEAHLEGYEHDGQHGPRADTGGVVLFYERGGLWAVVVVPGGQRPHSHI